MFCVVKLAKEQGRNYKGIFNSPKAKTDEYCLQAIADCERGEVPKQMNSLSFIKEVNDH